MRLIDLDELMKYPIRSNHFDTEHGNFNFVYGIESVLEYAEYLPIIDAVPVIRCKDCKYRNGDICIGFGDGHYVDKEGFCYCAERKVRCKDCKWFHKEANGEMWCGHLDGIAIDENAFCSDAKRNEE